MIPKTGTIDVYEDRFVITWRCRDTRRCGRRGKRVSADCPLTREEYRAYVTGSPIEAIKAIREGRSVGLSEAFAVWKAGQAWANGCERYVVVSGRVEFRKRYPNTGYRVGQP